MSNSEILHIKVLKWVEPPRKALRPWWFAIETGFFNDARITSLNGTEFRVFLYILTCAGAMNMQGNCRVSVRELCHSCKIRVALLSKITGTLEQLQLLTLEKEPYKINKINKIKKINTESYTFETETETARGESDDVCDDPFNTPEAITKMLLEAVVKFPSGDPGLAKYFGANIWGWLSRSRILGQVRAMDVNNPYREKNIMAMVEQHMPKNVTSA